METQPIKREGEKENGAVRQCAFICILHLFGIVALTGSNQENVEHMKPSTPG